MSGCVKYPEELAFRIVSLFGVAVNIGLFLLIRFHTPKMMFNYRRVLYASCLLDGCQALSHFLIGIRFSFIRDVLVINMEGPLPRFIDRLGWLPEGKLAYIMIFEVFFQISTLAYCFVPYTYRYFHIVKKTNFTLPKFAILLLVYLTPSIVMSVSIPILSAETYHFMVEYVGEESGECLRRIPIMDRRIYTEEPLLTIADICFSFQFPMIFCPFIFLFFLIRVFQSLRNDMKKSTVMASRMQKQITLTITAQSVIPILFVAFPVLYAAHSLIYNGEKAISTRILGNSLNLIPLINPIVTTMVVKSYREGVFRVICLGELTPILSRTSNSSSRSVSSRPIPMAVISPKAITV